MRSYDAFIEKVAATRWKKEFGSLSANSQNQLIGKFVDTDKYVAGLEKGNKALIEKLNPQIVSHTDVKGIKNYIMTHCDTKGQKRLYGDDEFQDKVRKLRMLPLKKYHEKAVTKWDQAKRRAGFHFGGPSSATFGQNGESIISGFKPSRDNPETFETTSALARWAMKRNAPKSDRKFSKSERRAYDALTLRHELDEIRSQRNHGNLGGYVTHNAPDVIHRESANLAFMPEKVKNVYRGMRENNGEILDFENHGFVYGESPYYNKKVSNKHVQFAKNNGMFSAK